MSFMFIKNKIRNALIIAFYFTGIPYLRFLSFRRRNIPLVRIICWHKVKGREQFEKKIRFLLKKFSIISVEDYFEQKSLRNDRINLVLSFDDGYKSWMENVLPVLEKYRLPALFFISSGYVNRSPEEERELIKKFRVSWARGLSKEEVKTLAENIRFAVGGHSRFHEDMANLEEEELEKEVLEDKRALESWTGREIKYFAVPFGHRMNLNEKIFQYYPWIFSIIPGFNRTPEPGKIIHRDSIDFKFSNLLFKSWLYGSYDLYRRSLR